MGILATYRAIAVSRGANWKAIRRDYERIKGQDRADCIEDEQIRRFAWEWYREGKPDYLWRKGLQIKFRQSFAEGDHDSIPGFDDMAREMADRWPGHFGSVHYDERTEFAPDYARAVYDYLAEPPRQQRKRQDILDELIELHAQKQAPVASFNPDQIESDPDKLDMIRQRRPPAKRQRQAPPAKGYVEFGTNIAALCLTDRQSLDPTAYPGTQEQRDGSTFVQITPTADKGTVWATATNGKAVAMVQCVGTIDRQRLCPAPVVPKSGAKPDKPKIAALDGNHWRNDKGVTCGRINEEMVEFPSLAVGVDPDAEGFALDVDDIVKLSKALGSKRLAFYPAPERDNQPQRLVAVLPIDPDAAIGAGVMAAQDEYVPTAKEFQDSLNHCLGVDVEPNWKERAIPVSARDDGSCSFSAPTAGLG